MRSPLPCRLISEDEQRYRGFADLLGSWGNSVRILRPARALAEPTLETTIDLFGLDEPGSSDLARQLLARRKVTGSPVLALFKRGRPRPASLALALGCDDGLGFPMEEDELRARLDVVGTLGLLTRECAIRGRLVSRFLEPGRKPPSVGEAVVALVGAPSPAHVKLADALPLRSVVFLRGIASLEARLRDQPPLMALLTADADLPGREDEIAALNRQARDAGCAMLLGAPAKHFSTERAIGLGFADRLATDDSPEELRLRLLFWLKSTRLRAELLAQMGEEVSGPAADPASGLFGHSMLLDYLTARESFPAGCARMLVMLGLGNLESLEQRFGQIGIATVLAGLGRRLRAAVRAEDLAARVAESAFCIVLAPTVGPRAEATAERVVTLLTEPLQLPDSSWMLPALATAIEAVARPAEAARIVDRALATTARAIRAAA